MDKVVCMGETEEKRIKWENKDWKVVYKDPYNIQIHLDLKNVDSWIPPYLIQNLLEYNSRGCISFFPSDSEHGQVKAALFNSGKFWHTSLYKIKYENEYGVSSWNDENGLKLNRSVNILIGAELFTFKWLVLHVNFTSIFKNPICTQLKRTIQM